MEYKSYYLPIYVADFSKAQFTNVYYKMVNIFSCFNKNKNQNLIHPIALQVANVKWKQNYLMNCLLTSEKYCFSLLLPQWCFLVETWFMFVFLLLHSHNLLLPSSHISKEIHVEQKKRTESIKSILIGCWLGHKNLRLLINAVEAKRWDN